uniref:Endonuclease/exonuclease/phosphatase domain-containing protein n=1 Tax=viral metagenome TaxID=1070528 RepID=A0A6C0HP19_9ZZZZ
MEYIEMSKKDIRCKKTTPYLCGTRALGRGLCVNSVDKCNNRTRRNRNFVLNTTGAAAAAGTDFGYNIKNIGRGCYPSRLRVDYEKINKVYDTVPERFSIMTYNIWGLSVTPNLKHLIDLRSKLLIKTVLDQDADMLCFQEMSEHMLDKLKRPIIDKYKFASEPAYKFDNRRNRDVDTYFVSKYTPKRIGVYGLPGVLEYKNSMCVVEFPNLIIFNLYLQAGSKSSIGQEMNWIHYSRCRFDLLNFVYDMIEKNYKNMNIIICGDLNFHLDGTINDWPEVAMLNKLKDTGFVDTFRHLHTSKTGFTEDTDLNMMRYNYKLLNKFYRYDGLFIKPGADAHRFVSVKSRVFGQELMYLNVKESEWFYKNMSQAVKLGLDVSKLKGVKMLDRGYSLPINASDHFGVITHFKQIKEK